MSWNALYSGNDGILLSHKFCAILLVDWFHGIFYKLDYFAVFLPYFRNFNTFSHIPCSPRYDTVFILEENGALLKEDLFKDWFTLLLQMHFVKKKKKEKKREKKLYVFLCLLQETIQANARFFGGDLKQVSSCSREIS